MFRFILFQVIKLLEQPQNSPSQVDITTLKSQLHEKDRLIEHLEVSHFSH